MNRRTFVARTLAGGAGLAVPLRSFGQNKAIEPGLSKLTSGKGLTVFNRSVSPLTDGTRQGIRLDEAPGEGLAYLEGIEFANGRIEVDIKGKDVMPDLLSSDDRYVGMPDIGDTANLTFRAPARRPGMERQVILHTRGFYKLHVPGTGDPDTKTLDALNDVPGTAAQFAAEQFKQWQIAKQQTH